MGKTKKVSAKKPQIEARLKVMGRFYEAKGKTVEEVIGKLKPSVAKTMAVLTLTKGKLSKWRVLQPATVAGLWGNRSSTLRTIAVRSITRLFSDFNE